MIYLWIWNILICRWYELITREDYIRENIEKVVDNYHKRNPLFKRSRATVLLNLLRTFEDMCRLNPMNIMASIVSPDYLDVSLHNSLDAIDMAIQWAYECCLDNSEASEKVEPEVYLQSGATLFDAQNYRVVCDNFTYYSRGRLHANYNEKNRRLTFSFPNKKDGTSIELADFIMRQQKKKASLSTMEFESNFQELVSIKDKLAGSIYFEGDQIKYQIDDEIWNAFYSVSKMQIDHSSELPDEWTFRTFNLGEYKQVWSVLLTIAQIHHMACLLSGKKGAAIESVVLLKRIGELCNEIALKIDLDIGKIGDIISFIIYNPEIKNNDVIWQPLINLYDDILAISPHLITTSNPERNLISLINKVEQASYSRVSNQKEDIMAEEILYELGQRYSHLYLKSKTMLPKPLPDIDLAIYDRVSKNLLLCEIKWLVSTDSIKEVVSRDADLSKGIDQAKKIQEYCKYKLEDLLLRLFNSHDIEVDHVLSCVVSKNNIGTSFLDDSIPILNQDNLMELFLQYNGDLSLIFQSINSKEYLPKENNLVKVKEQVVEYAGFKFCFPAITFTHNDTTNQSNKIGRNDPCPCGKINPNTGKVIKYKKCCGK